MIPSEGWQQFDARYLTRHRTFCEGRRISTPTAHAAHPSDLGFEILRFEVWEFRVEDLRFEIWDFWALWGLSLRIEMWRFEVWIWILKSEIWNQKLDILIWRFEVLRFDGSGLKIKGLRFEPKISECSSVNFRASTFTYFGVKFGPYFIKFH